MRTSPRGGPTVRLLILWLVYIRVRHSPSIVHASLSSIPVASHFTLLAPRHTPVALCLVLAADESFLRHHHGLCPSDSGGDSRIPPLFLDLLSLTERASHRRPRQSRHLLHPSGVSAPSGNRIDTGTRGSCLPLFSKVVPTVPSTRSMGDHRIQPPSACSAPSPSSSRHAVPPPDLGTYR